MGTTAAPSTAAPAHLSPIGCEVNTVDDAAFRRLFEETYRDLVAYARRRTSDHADADDIVSEVFAVAWRRRGDIETGSSPLPWLYGIAGNVVRNHRRAGGRRLQLVDRLENDPGFNPGSPQAPHADADDGAERLRAALALLSFDDQEVLRLVAWEGLTHAEIGDVLDCSTNAVGIRLHRARKRLQERLDDHQTEEGTTP